MMAEAGNQESAPGMIEVNLNDISKVDRELNEAIETVKRAATHHHTGIMVTRIGPGRYIVRAHPAVPFGLTREQHS